jgi:NADPH-dependent 2,4-dienoyl-CoA reductase/sulfur reductase-like enzyme
MEYAITAHARGHKVVIFEKSPQLGGVMAWAGNYKNLPNMEQIAYQPDWHKLMVAKAGIEVRLNSELTRAIIVADKPDVVVVATGAKPAMPAVAGLENALSSGFARSIDSALSEGLEHLADGPVVVWGAGEGVELALDLARAGRQVRLLDPQDKFVPANYIGSRSSIVLRWSAKVNLEPEQGVALNEVEPGKVVVTHADGRHETIACTNLIIAPGRVAYDPLSRVLDKLGIKVELIGDARAPRSYGNAIHEAAYLARRV